MRPLHPEKVSVGRCSRLERAKAIRENADAEPEQLKEQILTTLAGELRTSLTRVICHADLALEDIGALRPEVLN
jgi:signal transduction histidine kinase